MPPMGLDGVINLNKPRGITSAKALYRVRKITGQRKSGHAGTLDPGAEGVLVLCLGRATKLVEAIMDLPKVYRATARLDVTSESFDADRPMKEVRVAAVPARGEIDDALRAFEGRIEQVPPQISAIKVGGRPAYRLAGSGTDVVLRSRTVIIYWIHLHAYAWPVLEFEMACGRGCYVRSVIRDVGQRLDTGGCLTALRRQVVGPFRAGDAWTLEALQHADGPERFIIGLERARSLVARRPVEIPPRP